MPLEAKHLVDLGLVDAGAGKLRPVQQQLLLALRARALALVEEALDVLRLHHIGKARHALLDVLQGLDHLGDALAGDVLERAGLEDHQHLLVDHRLVGGRIARIRGHYGLGAFHDRVGRLLGRLHDGAELLAGRRDAAVLQVVHLQRADLMPHRLDIARDLAQLAVDLRIERVEEALQRLRGNFRKRDDVVEGDVVALLLQEVDQTIEMTCIRQRHSPAPSPAERGLNTRSRAFLLFSAQPRHYSANTASILVLSVCALNGLTM